MFDFEKLSEQLPNLGEHDRRIRSVYEVQGVSSDSSQTQVPAAAEQHAPILQEMISSLEPVSSSQHDLQLEGQKVTEETVNIESIERIERLVNHLVTCPFVSIKDSDLEIFRAKDFLTTLAGRIRVAMEIHESDIKMHANNDLPRLDLLSELVHKVHLLLQESFFNILPLVLNSATQEGLAAASRSFSNYETLESIQPMIDDHLDEVEDMAKRCDNYFIWTGENYLETKTRTTYLRFLLADKDGVSLTGKEAIPTVISKIYAAKVFYYIAKKVEDALSAKLAPLLAKKQDELDRLRNENKRLNKFVAKRESQVYRTTKASPSFWEHRAMPQSVSAIHAEIKRLTAANIKLAEKLEKLATCSSLKNDEASSKYGKIIPSSKL